MAEGDALTKQTIPAIFPDQDVDLEVACYQSDGTTARDMTGGAAEYLLTFYAEGSARSSPTITKTSAAGEIVFADPDDNSVTITIDDTDIPEADWQNTTMKWKLSGTDLAGDNEFVCAYGHMAVTEWP